MKSDEIIDVIKSKRLSMGVTQDEVAEFCELDRSVYARIEKKDRNLSIETADKLLKALGIGELGIVPFHVEGNDQPVTLEMKKDEKNSSRFVLPRDIAKLAKVTSIEDTTSDIYGQMTTSNVKIFSMKDDDNGFIGNRNIALIGGSEHERVESYFLNSAVQSIRRGESFIATDVVDTLVLGKSMKERLMPLLKREGYEVRVFNFNRDESQNGYLDILKQRGLIDKKEIIVRYANTIAENVYASVPMDKDSKMERDTALEALKTFITALMTRVGMGSEYLNLGNSMESVRNVFQTVFYDWDSEEALEKQANELFSEGEPGYHEFRAFLQLIPTNSSLSETIKNYRMFLSDYLYNDELMEMSKPLDLLLPGKSKCAYFIRYSNEKPMKTMAACLISALMASLCQLADESMPGRTLPVPVRFLLPCTPSLGVIENLGMHMMTGHKRGISYAIDCNRTEMLEECYPSSWITTISACPTLLLYDVNGDSFASELVRKDIGDTTPTVALNAKQKERKGKKLFKDLLDLGISSSNAEKVREKVQDEKENILLPDEVLVVIQYHEPVKVKRFYAYNNKMLPLK